MSSVLAAGLSISDQAQTIGAIAGLAAILGLAVLSLLYFAQAREVRRLREWAGRAPERAAELESRVAQPTADKRVVAQPQAPRPAAATPAGQAAAASPGAPGAPTPATPAGAAAAGAAVTPGAPGAPATPPVVPGEGDTTVQPTAPGVPPAAAPSGRDAPVLPAPAPAPRPAQALRATPGATRSIPAARAGAGASTARAQAEAARRRGGDDDGGGRRVPPVAIVVGAIVLVLIAGIFLATQLGGGGNDDKAASSRSTPAAQAAGSKGGATTGGGSSTSTTATTSGADKGSITVAVLNGTTVAGLANTVAEKVTGAGYKKGTVANAADQQRSATQVSYAPGHQAEGMDVAKVIGVGVDAVQPLDDTTAALAGTNAVVVVTVGSDQNR